jgi:hypothetical protein
MAKPVAKTQTPATERPGEEMDRRLRREMEARIYYFAQNPDQIDARLEELDAEWDIERVLAANAGGVSLFGILMARHHYKWLVLPLAAAGFLLLHAIQGWCPPVEILRRAGFRTVKEINSERMALQVLRGDFNEIDISSLNEGQARAQAALQATEGV